MARKPEMTLSTVLSRLESLHWTDPSRAMVTVKEIIDPHLRDLKRMVSHYIQAELGQDGVYDAAHGVIDLATKSTWPLYRRPHGPFEVWMHCAILPLYGRIRSPIHCKGYPIMVSVLSGGLNVLPYRLPKRHPRATIHGGDLQAEQPVRYNAGQSFILPDTMVHQVDGVAMGTVSLVVRGTKQISPRFIFTQRDDLINVEQPLSDLERLNAIARRLSE